MRCDATSRARTTNACFSEEMVSTLSDDDELSSTRNPRTAAPRRRPARPSRRRLGSAREPGGLVDVVQELVVVQHERDGELDRVPLQVFELAGLDQARLLGRGLLDAQDEQQRVVQPVLGRVERFCDLWC